MIIAIYVVVITALLLFPQVCTQSARSALTVWGLQVVPSLFPYMVFSKMMAEQIKKTCFPAVAVCILLGTAGGSPSGAAVIASLSTRLHRKYILSLCAFTGTMSPMFFFGTVSQWTDDAVLPIALYASQLIGACLAAVCVRFHFRSFSMTQPPDHPQGAHASPLAQSIDSILQIGGCIICFSVFASLIGLIPFPEPVLAMIHSVLEVTGGMHALIQSGLPSMPKRMLLAAVSGFSGLSVLTQNYQFLKPLGITYLSLLLTSALRALFSALFMLLFQGFR